MAGGGAPGVDLSRKFVSEAELDEKRKKRQEEWEKVRKPEDPEGKNTRTHIHMYIQMSEISCVLIHVFVCVLLRGPRGGV